jgi:hypothetical protein
MVSVSQAFDAGKDMAGLLHRILRQVLTVNGVGEEDALAQVDTTNVDSLATMLWERLHDRRYILNLHYLIIFNFSSTTPSIWISV